MIKKLKNIRNIYLAWSRKTIKERKYRFLIGKHIIEDKKANEKIYKMIMDNKPCFISRFGSTELSTIIYYMHVRLKSKEYAPYNDTLCIASGFFPFTDGAIDSFSKLYLSFIQNIDLLGVWNVGEDNVADLLNENITLVNLGAIEPYYFDEPWSRALAGKRVLVIHPFAGSIKKQYEKRKLLFPYKEVLPEFDLQVIPAVQSLANNNEGFQDWFAALDYMCKEIEKINFDVAIIGAGAYGMPLANFIKVKMGKVAIHMGGATQLLFGIKGKRWNDFPEIKKLYNENWINPSIEERPAGLEKVEGGSYW